VCVPNFDFSLASPATGKKNKAKDCQENGAVHDDPCQLLATSKSEKRL
jgi:hypothetical protein